MSLESPSTVFDPSGMRIDNLDPMDREDGGDDEEEEAEEVSKSKCFLLTIRKVCFLECQHLTYFLLFCR